MLRRRWERRGGSAGNTATALHQPTVRESQCTVVWQLHVKLLRCISKKNTLHVNIYQTVLDNIKIPARSPDEISCFQALNIAVLRAYWMGKVFLTRSLLVYFIVMSCAASSVYFFINPQNHKGDNCPNPFSNIYMQALLLVI